MAYIQKRGKKKKLIPSYVAQLAAEAKANGAPPKAKKQDKYDYYKKQREERRRLKALMEVHGPSVLPPQGLPALKYSHRTGITPGAQKAAKKAVKQDQKAARKALRHQKKKLKAQARAEITPWDQGALRVRLQPYAPPPDSDGANANSGNANRVPLGVRDREREPEPQFILGVSAAGTETAPATRFERSSSLGSVATPESSPSPSPESSPSSSPSPSPEPESLPELVQSSPEAYEEHPDLRLVPQAEIDDYLSTNFISISDPASSARILRPITAFCYLPFIEDLRGNPFGSFKSPTTIQAAAWPFLFDGRDVIGVAETGSGKTLAFAVPCVRYVLATMKKEQDKKKKGPLAVVVSPTRELAIQIHEQFVKLARPAGLNVVCIYGGVGKDDQRYALKTANVVIATPGRLNDFIQEGAADLSNVGYLVLDEADRMLDRGFEPEIRKIISTTPPTPDRQTVMFTATWPTSVRDLASGFMREPVKITIGDNPKGDLRANTSITQNIEVLDPRDKERRLIEILKQHRREAGAHRDDRILIFCLYKKEATRIENFVRAKGFRVVGIHGDLSQAQRLASLDAFKSGASPLLVATDVAARGLDIPDVRLVVNVTFPLTVEDYVHRIGRTGRAGNEGTAITLFTEHEKSLAGALINVLKAANQAVPEALLKFGTTVKRKGHDVYGAFYKETDGSKSAKKIKFDD
ncbi:MAG: RNA-dependent ATPase [Peltula sp. TS41687]|nr:MAG: RNA-dependent ATPase [Peltula sp. TS41687]